MKNIPLLGRQQLTTYRKISIASWDHPRDPSTYGSVDVPVEKVLSFLEERSKDVRITLTHFVAKAIANCLEKYPQLNHLLRLDQLYERARTDVFITTLVRGDEGKDLSGFVLRDTPKLSLEDVAELCSDRVDSLQQENDRAARREQKWIRALPTFLLRPMLRARDFVVHTLNLSAAKLGLARDRFGSVMISNIGALGIDQALIPLSPYSRCPLILGVGRVREAPVVRDGQVVVGRIATITFTYDHRYADGAHGAQIIRRFQKIFENPEAFSEIFDRAAPSKA